MSRSWVVPGRIELVGKHVDYAGGRSLTCAVDRAIRAAVRPLDEPLLRVRDAARRGQIEVSLTPARQPSATAWGTYVATVASRFARDFPHARTGADVTLRSDLPASSGLSSSSAFVVALGTALADVNGLDRDEAWRRVVATDIARAEYFAAMETGAPYGPFAGDAGVGVRGGAQDHVAIVCAQADSVGQFSYLPARLERRIPWPGDCVIAVAISGVHATKTGNALLAYNRASDATRRIVAAWNAATRRGDATLADALASGTGAAEELARVARAGGNAEFPGEDLARRLAQFREETEVIVPVVGCALEARDFAAVGALVDRSQALAEEALGNQVGETIFLARCARERGALAASAFGAGFGGAVWALVRADEAPAFVDRWRDAYASAFPRRRSRSQWLVTRPSGPLREDAA